MSALAKPIPALSAAAAAAQAAALPFRLDARALALPGDKPRDVMLRAARAIVSLPDAHWTNCGRGPAGWDWLGLIQASAQAARDHHVGRPAKQCADLLRLYRDDDVAYDTLERLLDQWALQRVHKDDAKPGDILIARQPHTYAWVLAGGRIGPSAVVVHAPQGAGPVQTTLGRTWDQISRVYGWRIRS